jgi:hypothetical protein
VAPYSLVYDSVFRGIYCLHLQDIYSNLQMESACSPKSFITTYMVIDTTLYYITEESSFDRTVFVVRLRDYFFPVCIYIIKSVNSLQHNFTIIIDIKFVSVIFL